MATAAPSRSKCSRATPGTPKPCRPRSRSSASGLRCAGGRWSAIATRPLGGQARIALRVGKVLGRRKVGKHFTLEITDTRFRAARDEAAIAQEAALDGIYVIRTSVDADRPPTAEAVRSYKRLAAVERAFRSLKTVDLKVRPIHHRKADRVRAHVFLCMLAYYVEWHMRSALAP